MPFQTADGWLYPISSTVVAGGSAGDHTIPGIKYGDVLISVRHVSADLSTTHVDLTSEFSVTSANLINNGGGTDTTGAYLAATWAHK